MTAKIKLNAASGGGSVSIVAPTSTTSNANVELKLPIADGSSDQVIKTDGSGNLSFGQAVAAKNLVHNGNFVVAQRGTSSTTSGYGTVDRFPVSYSNNDEALTQSQVDVASGTTPYSLGFRKALRATNGNQTSGAGAATQTFIFTKIEAQDIATSGWNYTDSNSFITLSFWVKSSVAQNFYGYILAHDGTMQRYAFETGSLSADTWTKITKKIAGNSNLQFDTDTIANATSTGFHIILTPYLGTDYTDNGISLNTWGAYASGTRTPDQTTTWYTTNDATFEITGMQLEVGPSASAFAHETFADTLRKCQRYFYVLDLGTNSNVLNYQLHRLSYNTGAPHQYHAFPVTMRSAPSLTVDGTFYTGAAGYQASVSLGGSLPMGAVIIGGTAVGSGGCGWVRANSTSGSSLKLLFSAEL